MTYRLRLNKLAKELVTPMRFGDTLTRFKDDWAQAEDIFPWWSPTHIHWPSPAGTNWPEYHQPITSLDELDKAITIKYWRDNGYVLTLDGRTSVLRK